MNSPQSNVNFPVLPKEIWFKILEICEFDSLYPMYWVNKLFQRRIEDKQLPFPFRICSVNSSIICEDSLKNLESSTKDFLSHHKFLRRIKHYKLEFLTHLEFKVLFDNPQLRFMINMLEIDTDILHSGYGYQLPLERALQFPNVTMLSLVNARIISGNFTEICSKSHILRYLKLCDGILSSFMDFGTCSFVNFSLDHMYFKSDTYIKMPHCLKKCDLNCCLIEKGLLPNSSIEFQMSHCKELKTL
jgi:hypothetical protein